MTLTVGSLFAGIGGLDLGLERAGMEVRWQVEIDGFCRQVLAKHWPDVKRYKDVKELNPKLLEPVDVICGGFPCQPISRAGQRKAQDDSRWLWPEFFRVLSQIRSQWVIVENTDGLPHRGLGTILTDLASIGYDAEWSVFRASDFGAPHERSRIYLVAYPYSIRCQANYESQRPLLFHKEWDSQDSTSGWEDIEYRAFGSIQRPIKPGICGVADGVPSQVDRLRALGNAVVPQIAEWIGEQIVNFEESKCATKTA